MIPGLADDITLYDMPTADDIALPELTLQKAQSDLFAPKKRKGRNAGADDSARADITKFNLHYSQRTGRVGFMSCFKKALMGPALADIKTDDSMIPFFAQAAQRMIVQVFGGCLDPGSWALVTTPRRRRLERNFAHLVCQDLSERIGIPFFADATFAKNKQRVNAVFIPGNIPNQKNIIVFDDFVTSGSTITSMKNLLEALGKTTVFFAGVDNKL